MSLILKRYGHIYPLYYQKYQRYLEHFGYTFVDANSHEKDRFNFHMKKKGNRKEENLNVHIQDRDGEFGGPGNGKMDSGKQCLLKKN